MRKDLTTGLIAVVVMTVFLGLVYPLAITGISQVVFPGKADGSLVKVDGRVVGSSLIGQEFKGRAYFHSRPSATEYSGNVTFFGNVGPNSAEGREEVREYIKAYLSARALRRSRRGPNRRGEIGQRQGPGRRRHPVGLGGRPPHLRRPTPGSRRTGSPPSAGSRSPRSKT